MPPSPRVPLTTAAHLERAIDPTAPKAPAPARAQAPAPEGATTVHVRATKLGFYADVRRKVGAEFDLTLAPGQKLPSWVERVDPS